MSHMVADTHDELIEMVKRIGVNEKWIQKSGTAEEHFDICESKRVLALRCGADERTSRELIKIIRHKRKKNS